MNSMRIDELIGHFVPLFFCIDDMANENVSYNDDKDGGYGYVFPASIPPSFESFGKSLYLMDIGSELILYVNNNNK